MGRTPRFAGMPALIAALAALGCDGYLGMEGRAHEWVRPPEGAESFVTVDGPVPEGVELVPLGGVEITLYNSPDRVGSPDPDDQQFQRSERSDPDGSYSVGFVAAPFEYTAAIEASKPGCDRVVHSFPHDGRAKHQGTIVLVCRAPAIPALIGGVLLGESSASTVGEFEVVATTFNPSAAIPEGIPQYPVTDDANMVILLRIEEILAGDSPFTEDQQVGLLVHSPAMMFGGYGFSGRRFRLQVRGLAARRRH